MKKLFGNSCLTVILVFGTGAFLALFIGSIIFNQVQAGSQNATATLNAQQTVTQQPQVNPSQTAPSSVPMEVNVSEASSDQDADNMQVGISTSTPSPSPFMTNTPGLGPLGTMSYPLTVTAEYIMQGTKVQDYRNQIGLTETAMEAESISIYATLTASAPKRGN